MMKDEKDLTQEMYDTCIPIAQDILVMLGKYENKMMGQVEQTELNKAYKDLVQEIKKKMLKHDLRIGYVEFVKQLLLQPIDAINYILTENINNSLGEAYNGFWGKDREDITFSDLDGKLKK